MKKETKNTLQKFIGVIICLTLMVTMLASCGAPSEQAPADATTDAASDATATEDSAPQEVVEIRFAHMNSTSDTVHLAAEKIKAGVEERTGGAVTIEIFSGGQLGENTEVLEQARLGGNIMGQFGVGHLEAYVPDYGIFLHPFIFTSWDEAKKVTESDMVAGWETEMHESHGVVVLGYANFGVRSFYMIDTPVTTPADLEGKSIRVQPVQMYTEMISALGAAPQTLPWMEVYSGLAQGVVDGAEAPPSSMLDQKHNEVVGYFSLTEHMLDVVPFCIGADTFDSLTAEQQEILREETQLATDWMTQEIINNTAAQVQEIEDSGVTVIRDVDKAAFQEATKNISEAFPAWSDGLYDNVMGIING